MKQITNEVLFEKIENLTYEVREGFTGVHNRQDKTNGNIKAHDKEIDDLNKKCIVMENKIKISKITWIVFGLIGAFLLFLLEKYI